MCTIKTRYIDMKEIHIQIIKHRNNEHSADLTPHSTSLITSVYLVCTTKQVLSVLPYLLQVNAHSIWGGGLHISCTEFTEQFLTHIDV